MGDLERDCHSLESRFQTSHIGQRLESISRAASFTKGPQDLVPVYSHYIISGTSHDLSEPKHADSQSRKWQARQQSAAGVQVKMDLRRQLRQSGACAWVTTADRLRLLGASGGRKVWDTWAQF